MHEPDAKTTIWKFVGPAESCMLVTRDGDVMRARPMKPIARPEQNAIWFFSDVASHKDEELRDDPRACLTFVEADEHRFVSLSGRVERIADKALIALLWSEAAVGGHSSGPDDPTLVLLRFEPDQGEYWEKTNSRIGLAVKFFKESLTGRSSDLGRSGKSQLP